MTTAGRILLEVCVASVEDAAVAQLVAVRYGEALARITVVNH